MSAVTIIAAHNHDRVAMHALTIIGDFGPPFRTLPIGGEDPDPLIHGIVFVSRQIPNGIPNRFLRRMPEGLSLREQECKKRGIELPKFALHAEKLILIDRRLAGVNDRFDGDALDRFRRALQDACGFQPESTRTRATQAERLALHRAKKRDRSRGYLVQ